MKKLTQKILLVLLITLLGSFFCIKSMEGMHEQSTENPVALEQTCCDTVHGPSLTKILPNDLAPQPVLIWAAIYFVAAAVLIFQKTGGQSTIHTFLVPAFIRFSKGIVQRE